MKLFKDKLIKINYISCWRQPKIHYGIYNKECLLLEENLIFANLNKY